MFKDWLPNINEMIKNSSDWIWMKWLKIQVSATLYGKSKIVVN